MPAKRTRDTCMVHKDHIVSLLRVNGISAGASDEEIRDALSSARWHEHDIDTALKLIQRNEADAGDSAPDPEYAHAHALRSGRSLEPQTLSALLGVSVNIPTSTMHPDDASTMPESDRLEWGEYCLLVGGSLLAAVLFGLAALYIFKLGPFYTPIM